MAIRYPLLGSLGRGTISTTN